MGDKCPKEQELVRVLVVAPSAAQLGCTITKDDVSFRLYFDPAHDRLVVRNDSVATILATPLATPPEKEKAQAIQIRLNEITAFVPGFWAVSTEEGNLVEFRVLPRTRWAVTSQLPSKRPAPELEKAPKRGKVGATKYWTGVSSEFLQAVSGENALVSLGHGQAIRIGADGEGYRLTRLMTIADQRNASVWQAEHSKMPGRLMVVKVINAPNASEQGVIRGAEAWERESHIHSSLGNHYAVLQVLGSDARFRSLYTEHVDARSLAQLRRPNWCFDGDYSDAQRILEDMASALRFVHSSKVVHNDVKPANILYSPSRGAVLIDFGLSFEMGSNPPKDGGSPWYLPPEFVADYRLRGSPADIWALGIVILWLLGLLPLPERTTSWIIADIHLVGSKSAATRDARRIMRNWIDRVEGTKDALTRHEKTLGPVLRSMLEQEIENRIEAAALEKSMRILSLVGSEAPTQLYSRT